MLADAEPSALPRSAASSSDVESFNVGRSQAVLITAAQTENRTPGSVSKGNRTVVNIEEFPAIPLAVVA